jgi:hypothetical protein
MSKWHKTEQHTLILKVRHLNLIKEESNEILYLHTMLCDVFKYACGVEWVCPCSRKNTLSPFWFMVPKNASESLEYPSIVYLGVLYVDVLSVASSQFNAYS